MRAGAGSDIPRRGEGDAGRAGESSLLPPMVSVVVAHFEQQPQLDRTLLALERQDYPSDRLEVIVVDDGSRRPPRVASGVRVLVQEDLGFRLAAARNAGAAVARGTVLCFLDADTTPEPGYVRELTRGPALVPDTVAVGSRRHADLSKVSADEPVEIAGPALELPAPAWLTRAYEHSRDLRDSDHRSYRYLIGAVLACSARFFDEVRGFDESFTDYGGEDWEWGYRAWLAGAVFEHVPSAVAWHDGPDWSGRSVADALVAKNREALRLTTAIPAVGSRGRGVRPDAVDVIVEVRSASSAAALFVCVDGILEGMPHATVIVQAQFAAVFVGDARIVVASAAVDRRLVRATVTLSRAARVDPAGFARAVEVVATGAGAGADLVVLEGSGEVLASIRSTRAARRRARWGDGVVGTREIPGIRVDWIEAIDTEPDLEGYLGGWA
ncbi:MAG: hypothetical protein RI885_2753 [Actinomycetota bacterium]